MSTTPEDNGWLDQMGQQEPQASEQWKEGDTFEPTGEERDANYLYTDLLAEPDTAADPYAGGPA